MTTTLSQQLRDAIEQEDLKQIEALVKTSPLLEQALGRAITFGKEDAALKLIELGADVSGISNLGSTLLLMAAEKGMDKLCLKLIEKGVAIDQENNMGETPLIVACENHPSTSLLLLEKGAKWDKRTHGDITALKNAFDLKTEDVCLKLLEKGAKFEGGSQKLLMHSAEKGFTKCCEKAIEDGAMIDEDVDGATALQSAARNGHVETCRMLRKKGAALELQDPNGSTALLNACASNKGKETANFLIDEQADIHATDINKFSTLISAISAHHTELALRLLDLGVDPHHKTEMEKSALAEAAHQGLSEVCLKLIDKDVDLEAEHWDKNTPLVNAIKNGMTEVAIKLIEKGADINAPSTNGPPLMTAIEKNDERTFNALLKKGADMYAAVGITTVMGKALAGGISFAKMLLHNGYKFPDWQRNMDAQLIGRLENGMLENAETLIEKEPERTLYFKDGNLTDEVLNACAMGRFSDLVANPLIQSKTPENLALFKEIWHMIPEYCRKANSSFYSSYSKACSDMKTAPALDENIGRAAP